ncbi:MAG: FKBP-type peptidyl-prolyl cis-trans isomerase [Pseudomonadota bacterium]
MQAGENSVVLIHYTLTSDAGETLDSSAGREPLAYLHGFGNIIPGLEQALLGKQAGDKLKVSIPPDQAYGVRNDELVEVVPRSAFGGAPDLEVGMQFQARTPEGMRVVTIVDVEGDEITLDGNHPLAGETLHFDVEIVTVRAATQEELAHGHVHGEGGHHH